MSEVRNYIRAMMRAGARKVLHRQGFRQPGGGWTLFRQHGVMRQGIFMQATWRDDAGWLRFEAWQSVRWHHLWSLEPSRPFFLDPVNGDAADLAVEVAHYFREELLPALEPRLDPVAMARELEQAWPPTYTDLFRAECIWRDLGRREDASRVAARLADLYPSMENSPF